MAKFSRFDPRNKKKGKHKKSDGFKRIKEQRKGRKDFRYDQYARSETEQ